jgi:PleD family two-component response regulator
MASALRSGSPTEHSLAGLKMKTERTVLLIDPAAKSRDRAALFLRELGYAIQVATPADRLDSVERLHAVVVAHPAGQALYPKLQKAAVPFIIAAAARGNPGEAAREAGADSYTVRPYRKELLAISLYGIESNRAARERAVRAELAVQKISIGRNHSALLDMPLFKTLLPLEIRRARRVGYPIALCVVGVDPLPDGQHLTNDVASATEPYFRSALRDIDMAVRYGEGRFLAFLPHTDRRGAEAVGKRIVSEFRHCRFRSGGDTLMLTASVGLAVPRGQPSFARLIKDAHAALKAAQLKGGDRAICR